MRTRALRLACGIIAAVSAKKLRPKLITVYIEGSAQDERCNALLAYANNRMEHNGTASTQHLELNHLRPEDVARIDSLAKDIETHCKPHWDPTAFKTYAEFRSPYADDGVYIYERFTDVDAVNHHEWTFRAPSYEDDGYLDDGFDGSMLEQTHFLVSFSDGSIIWYGSKSSPGSINVDSPEPFMQLQDIRPDLQKKWHERDEKWAAKSSYRGPHLHVCFEHKKAPVYLMGEEAEKLVLGEHKPTQAEIEEAARSANAHDIIGELPEVGHGGGEHQAVENMTTLRVAYYAVSSAPCWDCEGKGFGNYPERAKEMAEFAGYAGTGQYRSPDELRRQLLRVGLTKRYEEIRARKRKEYEERAKEYEELAAQELAKQTSKQTKAAPQAWQWQGLGASVMIAIMVACGFGALQTYAKRQYDQRRRETWADGAREAGKRATASEHARAETATKKREAERLRQERRLEALRQVEQTREAELAAEQLTQAEREAERRRHELAMRERARREAEAKEKPLSTPGPSHQMPKGGTAATFTGQTHEERARRAVEKACGIEAQRAHESMLREKEAARVAECAARQEIRRIGDRIANGDREPGEQVRRGGVWRWIWSPGAITE